MLVGNDNTVVVKGNTGSSAHAMTIDPAAMEHIMNVLTRIYSDNHMAVGREYVANALDSHREAGQTRPVEVTRPTTWEPRLIIQDFGVGLTKEDIYNVYSVYGISTRNKDNDSIGGLGIGSKVGFTLVGQFVVTGVKNGVKTIALFSLNAHGAPTVEVLSEAKCDEPNGVTVTISVDDAAKVNSALDRLSGYWPKGSVLINGHVPDSIYDDAEAIAEGIYLVPGNNGLTVDMGGIPYRVSRDFIDELFSQSEAEYDLASRITEGHFSLIAKVNIGDVTIAPNREQLSNTSKTAKCVRKIFQDTQVAYTQKISEVLDSASNFFEAFQSLVTYKHLVGQKFLNHLTYRGHKLGIVNGLDAVAYFCIDHYARTQRATKEIVLTIQPFLSNYNKYLVVTGMDESDINKVGRFATRFLTQSSYDHIICVKEAKGNFAWFSWGDNDVVKTVTFEEFRTMARKMPTVAQRNEVCYRFYSYIKGFVSRQGTASYITDNTDGEIYIYDGRPTHYMQVMLTPGDTVITLSNNQKLNRLVDRLGQEPVSLSNAWSKFKKDVMAGATEAELSVLGYQANHQYSYVFNKLEGLGYKHETLTSIVSRHEVAGNLVIPEPRLRIIKAVASDVRDRLYEEYALWAENYPLVTDSLKRMVQRSYYTTPNDEWLQHVVRYMKMIDKENNESVL